MTGINDSHMNKASAAHDFWWGDFMSDDGQSLRWRIGPLTLIATCLIGEWQISWQYGEDDEAISDWEFSANGSATEILEKTSRYIVGENATTLTIRPLLADRPVISRPKTTFNLIAGEEITVYVSTPLWMELAAGDPGKKLGEFAIQRASDTWFGPNTREGELCYASTTNCRSRLEELPIRPHRAITPVVIRNLHETNLFLERLNVPTPMLPLYSTANGQLWTSCITLTRQQEGEMASMNIADGPPAEARDAILLTGPRQTMSSSSLVRAFNALFS